jgi:prolyl-tRNA editing enzyme YbaK/EbsC (Cys-tRNA(Pro) deacylase)
LDPLGLRPLSAVRPERYLGDRRYGAPFVEPVSVTGGGPREEEIERRVDEDLRSIGIPYEVVECDPELADTAAFCAAYGYEAEDSANAILVVGKSDPPKFVACVVLATTRLDVNHTVRDRLGVRKASFADKEQTRSLTGMEIGGVTPFALPDEIPVWVDRRVTSRARIVLGGGSRRRKVVAAPELLTSRRGVSVVDDLALDPQSPQ